jgi:hypothetical protein
MSEDGERERERESFAIQPSHPDTEKGKAYAPKYISKLTHK